MRRLPGGQLLALGGLAALALGLAPAAQAAPITSVFGGITCNVQRGKHHRAATAKKHKKRSLSS